MNIDEVINYIYKKLKDANELNAMQKAWWIIEAVTKKNQTQLLAEKNFFLSEIELSKVDLFLKKYINNHMPLQYLIGTVPFLDLEILVESPVLIPRPETEYWCHELITILKKLENKKIEILDMATGSGCIALAIAKALPEASVFGVDISSKAITLAKKNLSHNKITNVNFIESDLFENINKKFDLIVTNPPYIDENLYEKLDLSVKNWEDSRALICNDEGLKIIKQIIKDSHNFLKFNDEFFKKKVPQLVIEIDCNQASAVKECLIQNQFFNVEINKDLQGKDRVVYSRR